METVRPSAGVGVLIMKEGKIRLGERLARHGSGTWSLPGGHLEFGETFEDAALREAKEETGLTDLTVERLVYVGSDRVYDKHFVTIGMLATWNSGEPYAAEPEKSQNWTWFDPEDLPENIFLPSRFVIEGWQRGEVYHSS